MLLSLDNFRYASGILTGTKALIGPNILDIGITNNCNMNCIGCYFHSHRKPDRFPPEWHNKMMTKRDFCALIDEACSMKIRTISISGKGEPLLHPGILDLVAYVKEKGMRCNILTNGTLLTPTLLNDLSRIKVDKLYLSLWDCDNDRYTELHPGYGHVFENLSEIIVWQKEKVVRWPDIYLYYMLSNRNFDRLQEMYAFALHHRIKNVHFKLFEVVDDITSDYLLTEEQINTLVGGLKKIAAQENRNVPTNSLSLAAYLQHIFVKDSVYHNNLLRAAPCYMGWFYVKVMVNGDVMPCCGCPDMVMGNIHRQSLGEIWNSTTYRSFRHNALGKKDTPMFRDSLCGNLCAHYHTNLQLGRIFHWNPFAGSRCVGSKGK